MYYKCLYCNCNYTHNIQYTMYVKKFNHFNYLNKKICNILIKKCVLFVNLHSCVFNYSHYMG